MLLRPGDYSILQQSFPGVLTFTDGLCLHQLLNWWLPYPNFGKKRSIVLGVPEKWLYGEKNAYPFIKNIKSFFHNLKSRFKRNLWMWLSNKSLCSFWVQIIKLGAYKFINFVHHILKFASKILGLNSCCST